MGTVSIGGTVSMSTGGASSSSAGGHAGCQVAVGAGGPGSHAGGSGVAPGAQHASGSGRSSTASSASPFASYAAMAAAAAMGTSSNLGEAAAAAHAAAPLSVPEVSAVSLTSKGEVAPGGLVSAVGAGSNPAAKPPAGSWQAQSGSWRPQLLTNTSTNTSGPQSSPFINSFSTSVPSGSNANAPLGMPMPSSATTIPSSSAPGQYGPSPAVSGAPSGHSGQHASFSSQSSGGTPRMLPGQPMAAASHAHGGHAGHAAGSGGSGSSASGWPIGQAQQQQQQGLQVHMNQGRPTSGPFAQQLQQASAFAAQAHAQQQAAAGATAQPRPSSAPWSNAPTGPPMSTPQASMHSTQPSTPFAAAAGVPVPATSSPLTSVSTPGSHHSPSSHLLGAQVAAASQRQQQSVGEPFAELSPFRAGSPMSGSHGGVSDRLHAGGSSASLSAVHAAGNTSHNGRSSAGVRCSWHMFVHAVFFVWLMLVADARAASCLALIFATYLTHGHGNPDPYDDNDSHTHIHQ